jgi:hypothetical protein
MQKGERPNTVGDSPETFARAAPSPESPAQFFLNGSTQKKNGSRVRRHGTAGPESPQLTETIVPLAAR